MRYSNAIYREVYPEVKQVAVQPTIESAVETFRPSDQDKSIEKEVSIPSAEPEVLDLETVVEPVKQEEVIDGRNSQLNPEQ